MAIANYGSPTSSTASVASSLTFSHTVGSGSSKLLVVGVAMRAPNGATVSSITFNGTNLTFLRSDTDTTRIRSELWYLVAPAETTANIVVTCSAVSGRLAATALQYTGVDQTTPFETNGGTAAASGTTSTVSVTTTSANAWLVDCGCHRGADETRTPTESGQTERADQNGGGAGFPLTWSISDRNAGTAGSGKAMSWSWTTSSDNAQSVGAMKPASAAAALVDLIGMGIIPWAR